MSDRARTVGDGIVTIAQRVGMKRGAVALGILAGGIGTFVLVRYLRAREDEPEDMIESNGVRTKKQKRAAKRAHVAHAH